MILVQLKEFLKLHKEIHLRHQTVGGNTEMNYLVLLMQLMIETFTACTGGVSREIP